MKPITVEQATIQTCAVEIKTLTLGKKQMTLSVFRQLPAAQIINLGSFALEGAPWGQVNYFWSGCGEEERHLHIVWSRDGRLFRSCTGRARLRWGVREGYYDPCFYVTGPQHALEAINCHLPPNQHLYWNDDSEQLELAPDCPEMEIKGVVGDWNEVVRQLAALDQLFIAV